MEPFNAAGVSVSPHDAAALRGPKAIQRKTEFERRRVVRV